MKQNVQMKSNQMSTIKHTCKNIGWQGVVKNGEIAGTSGKNLQLEAIKINLSDAALAGNIEYSTHIQNIGWQAYKANGALSGTTGKIYN